MQWFQEFPFYQARHPPDVSGTHLLYHHIAGSPAVAFSQNRPAMVVVGNISSHLPSISVPCLTRYTLWLDELR